MRESSNFWNIIPGPWNPPRRGKIGSNENYRRTHARRPGGNGSPDRARLRGAPRFPFVTRWFFKKYGGRVSELETKYILFLLFALGGLAVWAGSEAVLPAYMIGSVLAGTVGKD